jgi:Zn-dependent peptidase ImmA (M78 family)
LTNCYEQLVSVANSHGFNGEYYGFSGTRNGDCTFELQRIQVEMNNTAAQRIKTFVHELAHSILHAGEANRLLNEL